MIVCEDGLFFWKSCGSWEKGWKLRYLEVLQMDNNYVERSFVKNEAIFTHEIPAALCQMYDT